MRWMPEGVSLYASRRNTKCYCMCHKIIIIKKIMAENEVVVSCQPQSFTDSYKEEESLQTTPNANGETLEKGDNFPGSSVLQHLNQLEVVQRLDTLEVCLGWTRNNRYSIYNEEEEQMFYVYEASVCFHRQLTGALRGLVLKASLCDEDQEDVLILRRPGACSSRCCWACCNLQHMEVVLPCTGAVLASVQEVWNCCIPEYQLMDAKGERLWRVRGGACHCRCCCTLCFQFLSPAGEEIASVTRRCQGCKEIIGAANRYTIEFSESLTPEEKLIVLGSSFLIDLNYFEKQNKCW